MKKTYMYVHSLSIGRYDVCNLQGIAMHFIKMTYFRVTKLDESFEFMNDKKQ